MFQLGNALAAGLVFVMLGCSDRPGLVIGADSGVDTGPNNVGRTDAGGTGSDSGGVDAFAVGGPAPVRVTRGDPADTFVTCNFEARGWPAEDEGRLIILRLGRPDRPPERLVSAEARVERGAFRIASPMGCEKELYKRKALMVDVNGDGACTLGIDRIYVNNSFLVGDLTFVLAGSVPIETGAGERRMGLGSEATAVEACEVFNLPWPVEGP